MLTISGEHQKVRSRKLVSNTPAWPAFSATLRRSAFFWASCRASISASSWRLRASMSISTPTTLVSVPEASLWTTLLRSTQRTSPSGRTTRVSRGSIFSVS